ncbi:uncharacterized protein LOC121734728 [Aricia agestis]|uniref:uncharacterized protein LOC121734728 n=1 Tax=Aricia agestis TaxID=91739 RepID=UPI001C207018|nr:uncharacterized protein LOC121734728 [Aricia agestis]
MSLNRRTVILSLGYLKLVLINLLGLGFQIKFFYTLLAHFINSEYGIHWPFLAMSIATLAVLLVDTIFCVVLLVGGHKGSRSVLRVYFWLAIVGVIVAILRTGYVVANNVAVIMTAPAVVVQDVLHNPQVYAGIFWFGLVDIAIQITLLVFVRREIKSIERTIKAEAQEAELQTV